VVAVNVVAYACALGTRTAGVYVLIGLIMRSLR
jgi:hypothetical protein